MKKIIFMTYLSGMLACCISCNDDGTGEKLKERRLLIQNESKPLKTQYAALGIGAWVFVSAVGLVGHRYVNRKSK